MCPPTHLSVAELQRRLDHPARVVLLGDGHNLPLDQLEQLLHLFRGLVGGDLFTQVGSVHRHRQRHPTPTTRTERWGELMLRGDRAIVQKTAMATPWV